MCTEVITDFNIEQQEGSLNPDITDIRQVHNWVGPENADKCCDLNFADQKGVSELADRCYAAKYNECFFATRRLQGLTEDEVKDWIGTAGKEVSSEKVNYVVALQNWLSNGIPDNLTEEILEGLWILQGWDDTPVKGNNLNFVVEMLNLGVREVFAEGEGGPVHPHGPLHSKDKQRFINGNPVALYTLISNHRFPLPSSTQEDGDKPALIRLGQIRDEIKTQIQNLHDPEELLRFEADNSTLFNSLLNAYQDLVEIRLALEEEQNRKEQFRQENVETVLLSLGLETMTEEAWEAIVQTGIISAQGKILSPEQIELSKKLHGNLKTGVNTFYQEMLELNGEEFAQEKLRTVMKNFANLYKVEIQEIEAEFVQQLLENPDVLTQLDEDTARSIILMDVFGYGNEQTEELAKKLGEMNKFLITMIDVSHNATREEKLSAIQDSFDLDFLAQELGIEAQQILQNAASLETLHIDPDELEICTGHEALERKLQAARDKFRTNILESASKDSNDYQTPESESGDYYVMSNSGQPVKVNWIPETKAQTVDGPRNYPFTRTDLSSKSRRIDFSSSKYSTPSSTRSSGSEMYRKKRLDEKPAHTQPNSYSSPVTASTPKNPNAVITSSKSGIPNPNQPDVHLDGQPGNEFVGSTPTQLGQQTSKMQTERAVQATQQKYKNPGERLQEVLSTLNKERTESARLREAERTRSKQVKVESRDKKNEAPNLNRSAESESVVSKAQDRKTSAEIQSSHENASVKAESQKQKLKKGVAVASNSTTQAKHVASKQEEAVDKARAMENPSNRSSGINQSATIKIRQGEVDLMMPGNTSQFYESLVQQEQVAVAA